MLHHIKHVIQILSGGIHVFALLYDAKMKAQLFDPFHPPGAGEHPRSEHSFLGSRRYSPLGLLLGKPRRTTASGVPTDFIMLCSTKAIYKA